MLGFIGVGLGTWDKGGCFTIVIDKSLESRGVQGYICKDNIILLNN